MDQATVLCLLKDERTYQDKRWGTIEDHPHSIIEWAYLLRTKIDEAMKAWATAGDTAALECVREATALGVACMEEHGAPERSMADLLSVGGKLEDQPSKEEILCD